MSLRPETNKERLDAIQRSLPPDPKVKSRSGYASLDYFAELLGTDRQRLISWRKGAEPEQRFRERLAELSEGRYTADEFSTRRLAAEREAAVDQELADLRGGLEALRKTVAAMAVMLREQGIQVPGPSTSRPRAVARSAGGARKK